MILNPQYREISTLPNRTQNLLETILRQQIRFTKLQLIANKALHNDTQKRVRM